MNFKNRMFFIVLLVFFLLGILVSAAVAGGDEVSAQESALKTIRVAMNSQPVTLDPVNHRDRNTQTLHRMFSDALVWAKPDGSLVLDLAESITMINDVTYEIKIRDDVIFHNGDPMTADDLIFSITRLAIEGGMEGETSPRRSLAGPVKSVEKIDDYTVRVILEYPNELRQIRNWMHYDIWPKDYFEEVGVEGFKEQPIGVGPFKWVEGDLSSHVVLERHEDYYGGCPEIQGEVDRVPAMDRVIVNFVAEPTTRVAALLAGDLDIIQELPQDSIALIENNQDTKVVTGDGTRMALFNFNTSKTPLDDKRVRQAIAHAINYDLLVEQLLLGYSNPLYGKPFLEPFKGEPGYGAFDDIQGYDYNPEKAKALLEEAGVSGFSVVIDTTSDLTEESQVIAQMMGDIGIDASVRVWERGILFDEWRKENQQRDIIYITGGNARKSPEWARVQAGTEGAANWITGHYSNPTYDDLIERAIPMEDGPERNALFIEAVEILLEDAPFISIHNPWIIEATRSNVKNYFPCSQGRINLHKVDIEQ